MANELQANLAIALANVKLFDTIPFEQLLITQSVAEFQGHTISVTTGEVDLDTTGITTLGYLYVKNLDTTNYITYGPKSAGVMVAFGRLKAGEAAWLRLEPGITLRWAANTATVKVLAKLYGN